jgi:hypothetical protein
MRNRLRVAVGLAFFMALAWACQRSGGYRQEQEYYQPDNSMSYYKNKAGKSPTQRLESMGQPKKRVFVMNFWNDTPVGQGEIGSFAADELRRGLFLTQRMILPTDLRSESSTEDFIQGDKLKVSQLIREGRKLGVSALVVGRVTKMVFRQRGDDVGLLRQKQSLAAVDVEVKIFDVQGGREIMAAAKAGESSASSNMIFDESNTESVEFRTELLRLATRNAVATLVPDVVRAIEKMTWEGRIAKIANGKIYVNAGKGSGLVAGDILKVFSQGEDIYDPSTGALLGRAQGQLKGTVEVVDFIGPDGAAADIHTGGNFQENDLVQLY